MLAAAEVLAAIPVRDDGSDGYTAHHIFCTSKTGVAYSYDDIVLLPGAVINLRGAAAACWQRQQG